MRRVTERAAWTATTHDWASDLDRAHLAEIRSRAAVYEPAVDAT